MPAPIPAKKPIQVTTHGDTRTDDYAWLRDKDDQAVITHLEAENAYVEEMLGHTKQLQDAIYDEIIGRLLETDQTTPVPFHGYLYSSKTLEGLQYRIYVRTKGVDGPEQVLVDLNELAQGGYISLGVFDPSQDQRYLAYALDTDGAEYYTLRIKDLDTGEHLADEIEKISPSVVWSADGQTILYTTMDDTHRPDKVWAHVLGTPTSDDTMLFHEPDERYFVGVGESRDRSTLFINVGSKLTSESRFASADRPTAFRLVRERRDGVTYHVAHQPNRLLIWADDEGATDYRLCEADWDAPHAWRELIPHRSGTKIEDVDTFVNHVVLTERADGLLRLRVLGADGSDAYVPMPEPVYEVGVGTNYEYDISSIRIGYTSLTTPRSDYDLDLDTLKLTLLKEDPVLGGYDRTKYKTDRIYATARDGTRVPMSVVSRIDAVTPGPCLLYGYGSYGASMPAMFSSPRMSLLDRGVTYVIAHVRGGGELGETWRDDGRFLKKRHTFRDFIACADHLIAEGYTSASQLAIMGGSAGGLLMGAVINERPELFRAVVAAVPFVDSLNTMLDATLPLTVAEYEEWGNPEDPEYYRYMKSYAPYENVSEQAYPDILATGGLTDPRVGFWEPTKWVAKLRDHATNEPLIVLKMQMGAGHAGPAGRYDAYRETALLYAFVLDRIQAP